MAAGVTTYGRNVFEQGESTYTFIVVEKQSRLIPVPFENFTTPHPRIALLFLTDQFILLFVGVSHILFLAVIYLPAAITFFVIPRIFHVLVFGS